MSVVASRPGNYRVLASLQDVPFSNHLVVTTVDQVVRPLGDVFAPLYSIVFTLGRLCNLLRPSHTCWQCSRDLGGCLGLSVLGELVQFVFLLICLVSLFDVPLPNIVGSVSVSCIQLFPQLGGFLVELFALVNPQVLLGCKCFVCLLLGSFLVFSVCLLSFEALLKLVAVLFVRPLSKIGTSLAPKAGSFLF